MLPCHLHLFKFTLNSFYGKNPSKDLILTAPIPQYFKWTCDQLGLDTENLENLNSNNLIKKFPSDEKISSKL